MPESLKDRAARLDSLDAEAWNALRREIGSSALDVFGAVQSPAEWFVDEQPVSIELPAGEWARIVTCIGVLASVPDPTPLTADAAYTMQAVVAQLAAAKTPVAV